MKTLTNIYEIGEVDPDYDRWSGVRNYEFKSNILDIEWPIGFAERQFVMWNGL